ncbi:MAG: GntR family transcriptional regulator, partial [Rhodobacteraceae bacterium]|nr:GntR family transcriptional regulator [Paracoccaceae bacterium]
MTPRGEYKPGNANRPGENTSMSSGKNLNEIAYRTIKDDIISCALQPGDDISEATLLARYGFSKAPIRSALLRLRQEGLVVSRGRRGNMVSQVTFRDVQEIFQLRLMLEVVATRLAAGKVDPDRILNLNNAVVSSFSAGREQKDETEYMK